MSEEYKKQYVVQERFEDEPERQFQIFYTLEAAEQFAKKHAKEHYSYPISEVIYNPQKLEPYNK
jgi:hypothetical protein